MWGGLNETNPARQPPPAPCPTPLAPPCWREGAVPPHLRAPAGVGHPRRPRAGGRGHAAGRRPGRWARRPGGGERAGMRWGAGNAEALLAVEAPERPGAWQAYWDSLLPLPP